MRFGWLQEEHGEWGLRNFPTSTHNQSFHGIVEETGELVAAYHSGVVASRDGDRAGLLKADADFKDAIGDVLIFVCDYCSRSSLWLARLLADVGFPNDNIGEFQLAVSMSRDDMNCPPWIGLMIHVGNLAHARLKAYQGIRGDAALHAAAEKVAVAQIVVKLAEIATAYGWSLGEIAARTWETVKAREWTVYAETGVAVADAVEAPEPDLATIERALEGPTCPPPPSRGIEGDLSRTVPDEPEVFPAGTVTIDLDF